MGSTKLTLDKKELNNSFGLRHTNFTAPAVACQSWRMILKMEQLSSEGPSLGTRKEQSRDPSYLSYRMVREMAGRSW